MKQPPEVGTRYYVSRSGVGEPKQYWALQTDLLTEREDAASFEMSLKGIEFYVNPVLRQQGIESGNRITSGYALGTVESLNAPNPEGFEEVFYRVFTGPPAFTTADGRQVWKADRAVFTKEGKCLALGAQ